MVKKRKKWYLTSHRPRKYATPTYTYDDVWKSIIALKPLVREAQ